MTIPHAGRPSPADPVRPVAVIGISGATWSVIDPMISAGALPAIRRLMREGSSGVLESVRTHHDKHYRPQTAWPSLLTGKLPENHGITEYYHTCRNLKSPGIWDFFNARGHSAGLYSTPVLWPPPEIDGFVIPAPHGRDDSAWPPDLSFIMDYYRHHQDSKLRTQYLDSLKRSLRFVPVLLGPGQDRVLPLRLLRDALKLAGMRDREIRALVLRDAKLDFSAAVFLWLYRKYKPRFSIFTSFEVDYVSHRYWRYHEPGRFQDSRRDPPPRLREAVRSAYAHMDQVIGLIVRRLPEDCIIAVVSEHGMAAETTSNEIGRWQYMINGGKVKALAGVGDDLIAVPIARWIAFRRRDGGPLDHGIESRLRSITVPETGLPLFSTHFHAVDEIVIKLNIHRGDYQEREDIGTLHVEVPGKGRMGIECLLEKVGPRRSAMHAKEGVLVLKGRGIRPGGKVEGAVITDIMPTLLAASGLPVPDGLDGKVLDLFS